MKLQQQVTVKVTGEGESKQQAFARALSSIQKEILKNNTNIILRIEPVDVSVITATVTHRTEKFLYFFLPRKRSLYSITLDVTVDICLLDMNQVDFTEV